MSSRRYHNYFFKTTSKNYKNNDINNNYSNEYFLNSQYLHTLVIMSPCVTYKNAEKELLIRISLYCKEKNIDFIEIDGKGRVVLENHELFNLNIRSLPVNNKITVISVHELNKKLSDHYTLLACWNPVLFITSNCLNIRSYDGYLSSYSESIDSFGSCINDNDKFCGYLNTSLPISLLEEIEIIDNPRIFYIGTNWDLLEVNKNSQNIIRGKIREFLKILDTRDMINIYGPEKIKKKYTWEGYNTYSGEIDFDGFSVIKKIKETGICLALSTQQHIRSKVCSMRIFEGIAAGVPIICDKNPFFIKYFGDNVFYIDLINIEDDIIKIEEYIDYFKNNKNDVLKKINTCREIFIKKFSFDLQFANIINKIRKEDVIKI